MTTSGIIELITAVAYIRMSTSRQEDSPERQRRQINEYADRHGYRIIRWYEDHGMTGTESAKRTDYQQLIADSTSGAFTAVLIAEMSRMSREDLFTVIPQWGAFRDAGISLVSCQRGLIDFSNMGGFLCAIIDQYSAHDESRKFADRTVSGKLTRILKGERVSGNRIFGFDRNIVDASGHVLKRVSFRDQFIKPVSCQSILVPSAESESVEAVKWGFQHMLNGGSLCGVTREFNRRGLLGTNGNRFHVGTVRQILTNPAYAGDSRSAYKCRGKFSRMSDTHKPILTEGTHSGIVDKLTFESVSSMIETKSARKDKWRTFLLSGLCRCGHCGKPMSGRFAKNGNQNHQYSCFMTQTHVNLKGGTVCEVRPSFDGQLLERAVISAWCDVFLVDDVTSQLKLKPTEDHSKHEQNELKTLVGQISTAESNLALASTAADFKTVSTVLAQLRKREASLRESLSRANRKLADLAPEILDAIKGLKNARGILDDWPNVGTSKEYDQLLRDLAVVFKKTISSVTLRADLKTLSGQSRLKRMQRRTGVVSFNAQHLTVPDAILTDEMLAHPWRRQFRKVAEYLASVGGCHKSADIALKMKQGFESVLRALAICRSEGLVERTDAGWSAIS